MISTSFGKENGKGKEGGEEKSYTAFQMASPGVLPG